MPKNRQGEVSHWHGSLAKRVGWVTALGLGLAASRSSHVASDQDLALFGQSKKSSNFFLRGASSPTDLPPSSRLLSQPPQDRFERLSQVGRCRGLHGGEYLVKGLECRSQDSQVIPNQACRFRNFFLGPIPELFSASFSPHVQEIPPIMSTPLTRRNLRHFQEIQQIMSGQRGQHNSRNFLEMRRKTCRNKFRNGAQKKNPESAGLVGGPGPSLGPALT